MWHAAGFFSTLFLLVGPYLIQAQLYSEGGGNEWTIKSNKAPLVRQQPLTEIVDELKEMNKLQQQQQQQQQYDAEQPYGQQSNLFESYEQPSSQYVDSEADELLNVNPLELAKIDADVRKLLKQQQQQQQEEDEEDKTLSGQPEQLTGPTKSEPKVSDHQKRGQFEFVEFVEPHAKALKNVEYMDKRAPVSEVSQQNSYLYSTNNVLFIVAVTMCSVVVIAGIVGGTYHINNIRKQRNEAFDDFTRYSPAGPGRELRRGRGFAGSPVTDSGDDALTKAAHLHHYEQTKQKIIGADNGITNDDQSDDETDDLEEHNFSIYECPGLAMSGDIEVKNPNFEQQHP